MSRFHFSLVVTTTLFTPSLDAAVIDLQSAIDGSSSIVMSPWQDVSINLVIITSAPDTISVSFVNAFLNADNDYPKVDSVIGAQNWTYDRSAFSLPAELDAAGENEYGLVSGDSDGSDGLPLGSATHVIDVITLYTHSQLGSTKVTFETGDRGPQVFGPAPTYYPFPISPPGFPHGFPNFLFLGDSNGSNSAFTINYVPEPELLCALIAGLGVLSKRR